MLVRRPPSGGFTLIELMVTISLIAILLGMAIPSFSTWIRNQQVRTVANSLQDGLRTAQTEAVRRSTQVVFTLTNNVPNGAVVAAVENGKYWAAYAVPLLAGDSVTFLQGGPLSSAGGAATIKGDAAICFNGAGRLTVNNATGVAGATCTLPADGSARQFNVSRDSATSGVDRPLRVTVSLGGQVRMCDPARTQSTSADGC